MEEGGREVGRDFKDTTDGTEGVNVVNISRRVDVEDLELESDFPNVKGTTAGCRTISFVVSQPTDGNFGKLARDILSRSMPYFGSINDLLVTSHYITTN